MHYAYQIYKNVCVTFIFIWMILKVISKSISLITIVIYYELYNQQKRNNVHKVGP